VTALIVAGWIAGIIQACWSRKLFEHYERVTKIEVTKLFSAKGMISGTVNGDYLEHLRLLKGIYF
jgi:hypothetical protein